MGSDDSRVAPKAAGGLVPALTLFFLAPLVGEFLLGNLPITWLWLLIVLAPLYGGGALLIRETARRFGLGWPGIILLALAYAVLEEALVTQSLFNPNYVGQRLLDYGYVPALGMGSWWTVFVLGIHVIWSVSTPIALAEALSGGRRRSLWLGKVGLTLVILVFVAGCALTAKAQPGTFHASGAQLAASSLVVMLAIALAFVIGRKGAKAENPATVAAAPRPIVAALFAFLLGSLFMLLAITHIHMPPLANVFGMLFLVTIGCVLLARWGRSSAWSAEQELGVAAGFLLTYAWYGFVQVPSVGQISPLADAIGNAFLAAAALALLWIAWKRVNGRSILALALPRLRDPAERRR